MVFIPQGISIAEQKCYLLHPNDSQAIISCLDAHNASMGVVILVSLVSILLLIAALWWLAK